MQHFLPKAKMEWEAPPRKQQQTLVKKGQLATCTKYLTAFVPTPQPCWQQKSFSSHNMLAQSRRAATCFLPSPYASLDYVASQNENCQIFPLPTIGSATASKLFFLFSVRLRHYLFPHRASGNNPFNCYLFLCRGISGAAASCFCGRKNFYCLLHLCTEMEDFGN